MHQWVPRVIQGNKCQLSMSHVTGEGPDGVLGSYTYTVVQPPADCYSCSPAPGGFAC